MTALWKLRCPIACEDWGTWEMVLSLGQTSQSLCQLCKKHGEFFGYSLFSLNSTSKECNTPSDVMQSTLVVIIPSDGNCMENLQAWTLLNLHWYCFQIHMSHYKFLIHQIWCSNKVQENRKEMVENGKQKAPCCSHMCTGPQEWETSSFAGSLLRISDTKLSFLEWLRWGSVQDSHMRSFLLHITDLTWGFKIHFIFLSKMKTWHFSEITGS